MTSPDDPAAPPVRRYGFAVAVVGVVAAMTVLIAAKSLIGGKPGEPSAAASAQKSSAAKNGPASPRARDAAAVEVETVERRAFSDAVRTLGTAQARESVTITAKVTDTIRSIRFESGDFVKKGQVLVELANVEQAADLKEARAQMEVDRRAYLRFKELFDKGFSPKAKLDEAEAALARSQAQVEGLQSRIADRTIRAPFAGVVGIRTASPGMLATPGAELATLDDVTVIKLDFDVPEPQLPLVKIGAPLEARSAALPKMVFTGNINEIDTRVNTNTRTVRVRALIPNKNGRIKPGMLMRVEVRSNEVRSLAAPEIALLEVENGVFVFRVAQKGPVLLGERVKVVVGRRRDGQAEVLKGLKEGDQIVVQGLQRVRPGQPLRIAEPASAEVDIDATPRDAAASRARN